MQMFIFERNVPSPKIKIIFECEDNSIRDFVVIKRTLFNLTRLLVLTVLNSS